MTMPRFVILVPAFHMEKYIVRCLRSALTQNYPRDSFRLMFVEDHGADATWALGNAALSEHARETLTGPHTLCWTNRERLGILGNHVAMLAKCDDEEIAVCLDGDDQLAHPDVLNVLTRHYADPNCWLTYGSYNYDEESRTPGGTIRGACAPIPPDNHTRHAGWSACHLKTFKVWLFRQIMDADLRFRGEYIDPAGDVALMSPMIEMAGPAHARYIEEALYLYNWSNPLNDSKIKPAWIRIMAEEVKSRPIYPRLERRP